MFDMIKIKFTHWFWIKKHLEWKNPNHHINVLTFFNCLFLWKEAWHADNSYVFLWIIGSIYVSIQSISSLTKQSCQITSSDFITQLNIVIECIWFILLIFSFLVNNLLLKLIYILLLEKLWSNEEQYTTDAKNDYTTYRK